MKVQHHMCSDDFVPVEVWVRDLTEEHEQDRVRLRSRPEVAEDAPPEAKPNQGLVKCWEKQRGKTHCPFGHRYTKKNTRIGKSGGRFCRSCVRERSAARRAKAYWERGDGTLLGMLGAMG